MCLQQSTQTTLICKVFVPVLQKDYFWFWLADYNIAIIGKTANVIFSQQFAIKYSNIISIFDLHFN